MGVKLIHIAQPPQDNRDDDDDDEMIMMVCGECGTYLGSMPFFAYVYQLRIHVCMINSFNCIMSCHMCIHIHYNFICMYISVCAWFGCM